VAPVALRPLLPDPPASRGRATVLALACLASIGVGVALATRAPADRAPAAIAAPPAAVAEDEARRLARAIGLARASTVALEYGSRDASGRRRVATGVVVSERGDILSVEVDPPPARPDHERPSIVARDEAGHRHRASWVAADPETGLTLLRVEADDIRPALPASRAPELGSEALMIGNPYGLGHSVGRGFIAGVGRRVKLGPRPLGGLIQVQMPLHPGDGGAQLADLDGAWLGVVRGGLGPPDAGPAQGDENLGLAIPARDALWVAGQLREHGKVDRAYLGVWFNRDGDEEGAEFSGVRLGSPADLAGLKPGDRVVRLDDRPVRSADDLTDRLDRTAAGAEVAIEFARGTARIIQTLRTASRPPDPPAPAIALNPAPPANPAPAPAPILERFDRLERRLDELERRDKPAPTP